MNDGTVILDRTADGNYDPKNDVVICHAVMDDEIVSSLTKEERSCLNALDSLFGKVTSNKGRQKEDIFNSFLKSLYLKIKHKK